MSLPKTLSDKFPKNALSYFRFYLVANWQQFILYVIIGFLALVLPTILDISEVQRHGTYLGQGRDVAQAITIVFVVVSCVLGIFSGMAANSYVNSKQATNCFHSIPMRRESLFVTEGAARFLYYIVSSSAMYSISMSLLLLTYGVWENGFTMIWNFWLIGVLSYLIVFTLFQLASALTATAGFRFCMAGIIAFLPIALYALVLGCVSTSMASINTEYYLETPALRWLCPAYLIIYVTFGLESGQISHHALQILSLLLPSVIYYAAAILIHRKRKSEMAANSVVWNKIKVIVKYLVVFTAGICGALLMYSGFGGGFSWMVFGTVCGLVLSFILMNVLINRSTKSMFKGLPGLGITTLVTGVFLLVFMFDVFGINNFMYSAGNIREIRMNFQYYEEEIVLTEREDIEKILPALLAMNDTASYLTDYAVAEPDKFIDADAETEEKIRAWFSGQYDDERDVFLFDNYHDYVMQTREYETNAVIVGDRPSVEVTEVDIESAPYYKGYLDDSVMNSRRVYYTVKPKFGITLAKTGRTHPHYVAAKSMEQLAYSKGYMNYITELENRLTDSEFIDLNIEYSTMYWYYTPTAYEKPMQNGKSFLENLVTAYKQDIPEGADSPLVGNLGFHVGDGKYFNLPLHAGMSKTLDTIAQGCSEKLLNDYRHGGDESVADSYCPAGGDFIDWLDIWYSAVLVVERGTGRSWLAEDPDDIHTILSSATSVLYSRTNILSGAGDTQYILAGVRLIGDSVNIDMMIFRDNVIPACVTEKFS